MAPAREAAQAHLARVRGEVGAGAQRKRRVKGLSTHASATGFADRAPHPDPLPVKDREREKRRQQATRMI
jgi:hypothetical protein